jgi:hypothetical protein
MKRINLAKQYEAQCRANVGLSRWVLPWQESGDRYRSLCNEMQLGLLVVARRVVQIPARYKREADRELLALALRLLCGAIEPDGEKPQPRTKKRLSRPDPKSATGRGCHLRLVTSPRDSLKGGTPVSRNTRTRAPRGRARG